MTRIIAGFAGSLRMAVPATGTRPTGDRVREAIFSALEARDVLAGARVVDLFAGSGSIGLEAVSRGAASATLVERNAATATVCRENAARVIKNAPEHAVPVVDVVARSVQMFLDSSALTWDVAFLDPPYELSNEELALNLAALQPRLADGAVVVVERGSKSPEPVWPGGIALDRRKNYGDTTLLWASTVVGMRAGAQA
ncbi:MAG: 16S rRNA (guanine(966)-N(2))-methyltransferase RsmD [Terrimesophilobacter sp.]